ncbi:MAG TPA: peptidylprolyl isomerase [Ilumatobacteraceae bacterium]|nr:peptidylprolyl isomerase [Ilumatobacteraceae bacterium]
MRPPNYTLFGQVTAGLDVVEAMNQLGVAESTPMGQQQPTEPITLDSITITES